MVMVMMIVKVDGEGDCGDDSGCDVEGVAWRITRSNIIYYFKDIAWNKVKFYYVHFTALRI